MSSMTMTKLGFDIVIIIFFVGWGGCGERGKTNSQIRDTVLCRSVTKNLTDYSSAGWGLNDMKAEIHSFPTMYIIGGVSGVEMGQN